MDIGVSYETKRLMAGVTYFRSLQTDSIVEDTSQIPWRLQEFRRSHVPGAGNGRTIPLAQESSTNGINGIGVLSSQPGWKWRQERDSDSQPGSQSERQL